MEPSLNTDIQLLIAKTNTVQTSATFKAVLKAMADVAAARKEGKPTKAASDVLAKARTAATDFAKDQLQGSLNTLLAKLSPGEPFYKPFGFEKVTVPWQDEQVDRAKGVKALITPKSIRADGVRADFNKSPTDPSWWSKFKTAEPPPVDHLWDRGHLLASKLGGPGGTSWENMVPLLDDVNQGVMKNYESIIAKTVLGSNGKLPTNIVFQAIPTFTGNKLAPDSVRILAVSQKDDGMTFRMDVTILNKLGAQPKPTARLGW